MGHDYPDIRGAMLVSDVAELLGVTVHAVKKLRQRGQMPAPAAVLGRYAVWEHDTIAEWARTRRRPGGRPAPGGTVPP